MSESAICRTVFATELGWMAMIGRGEALQRLVFGYASAADAEQALGPDWLACSRSVRWNPGLRRLLEHYAAGRCIEFDEVPVEASGWTEFGLRVLQTLRKVPYGQTITYGALAAEAGSPGAARAAGNWMAANPVPLVIPCHRVVCSCKRLGNFSAPGGAVMKRRLLEMEGQLAVQAKSRGTGVPAAGLLSRDRHAGAYHVAPCHPLGRLPCRNH